MKLTPKIRKAIDTATTLHRHQKRKVGDLPYATHIFSVAWILENYTDDEDVICAALLHDVLEDVKDYPIEKMQSDFGDRVAGIVREVSEDKNPNIPENAKDTWEYRKNKYLEDLRDDSYEAMLVSAADKIHNLDSMIVDHETYGDEIWEKFNSPMDKKIWFYGEVLKILREKLDNPIINEFEEVFDRAKKILGS
jgi:(p)ppGpp synthase/HD superfamily hydrolase